MSGAPKMRMDERIGRLFDYAVDHPDGFTYDDLFLDLGWSYNAFMSGVRGLRRLLGDDDLINMVCDPDEHRERWRYRLVGNLADAHGWIHNRLGDSETRLETILSVCSSVMAATDGRTHEGRKARTIVRALTRLIEDLGDLDANGANGPNTHGLDGLNGAA